MTDHTRRGVARPSRRRVLHAGAAAAALPFGPGLGSVRAWGPGPSAPFDPGPLCSPAVAKESGIFARHGLDVDFVNFGGSTEALLEAIATGKADAGIDPETGVAWRPYPADLLALAVEKGEAQALVRTVPE